MFCPKCGAEVSNLAQACSQCGQAVAVSSGGAAAMPAPVASQTSGLAIASLVLGIVWIYGVGSVLALIFGIIARKNINASAGAIKGRGMAIAGIILGVIGIIGAIGLILATIFVLRTHAVGVPRTTL